MFLVPTLRRTYVVGISFAEVLLDKIAKLKLLDSRLLKKKKKKKN